MDGLGGRKFVVGARDVLKKKKHQGTALVPCLSQTSCSSHQLFALHLPHLKVDGQGGRPKLQNDLERPFHVAMDNLFVSQGGFTERNPDLKPPRGLQPLCGTLDPSSASGRHTRVLEDPFNLMM